MKLISLITLICFMVTNVIGDIYANITYSSLTYNESFDIENIINKNNLSIKYGQIEEAIYKPNTPLVVIINDLHQDPIIQSNIEQIINFLKQNSNLDKLIVEGAPNKQIKTDLFLSIPEQQRTAIADKMLNKGRLSGAETFGIKNNFNNLFGLEQWDIYSANLQRAKDLKYRYTQDINIIKKSFIKHRISFPKGNLFPVLTHENSLNARLIKIGEFCKKNKIDLSIYPDLDNFIYMQTYRNINSVNDDFSNFLNDIKKQIPYNIYSYITSLLKQSNNMSTNLALLFEIAKLYCPQILIKYENLITYFKHIEMKVSIRSYLLLKQLDLAENMILDKYADFTEKDLSEIDRFIYLLSEYTNLSLTYNQYQYLQEKKQYLYQISFKYLDMNSMGIINNILNDNQLNEFYSINTARNDVFFNNIQQLLNLQTSQMSTIHNKMEDTELILNNLKINQSVNIVVVGGFHNQLIDMLKDSEVSILSIIPNIEGVNLNDDNVVKYQNIVYHNALAPPIVCVQSDIQTITQLIINWLEILQKIHTTNLKQKEIIQEWLDKNNIKLIFDFDINGTATLNNISLSTLLQEDVEIINQPIQKDNVIEAVNKQQSPEQQQTTSSEVSNSNQKTEIKIIKKSAEPISIKTKITQWITRTYSQSSNKILNFIWTLNNIKFKYYSYYLNIKAFFKIAKHKISNIFNKFIFSRDAASISSEYLSRKLLDERIIKNEYKRTLDSLNGEMPDIIIITVDNIDDIEFCENILTDIKNHPNFSKTMIKYIVKDRSGTGIGFTQAVQYLQDNNLKKQKEDIKAVIIDIENENKDVIANRDLPLQFNGRNITPLELAVLNGIRSCHKFQNSGGIAVIDPNNIYMGNMVPTGDITFISSAVNIKEIQNHQMSLVLKEYPDKLEQIYYGFNPDKISDIVERKGIEYKNYYNFDNQEIKQFEVITGNILIKFDKKDNYLNFFDFMSAIGNYAKQGTNKVNLIQHIFVPFIRANHHSKVQSYFAKTRPKNETSDERNFFLGLAEIFNRPANTNFQLLIDKIKFGVYQQSKSFYSKNFSQITFDKLSAIVKAQQTVLSYNNKSSKTKFFKQLPIKVTGKFKEDTALSRAYMLLSQIQNKQLDSLVDYEQVYETLIEIVRTTTFQRELYTTDNVNTAKLYIYMSDFISNTIVSINKEMESDNSKIDRIYLENLKITFLSLQNYTIEYIRLLDYTSNLSTLGGYVYPKDSWFEKYKLMPFNRFVFGFSRGIKKSKKDVRQQATTVYSLGNFLIESLYSFPILKKDIESFIEEFDNPKQKTSVGMQKQWGSRRAIQRFLSLTIALQSFTTTVITNFFTANGAIGTAVFSLITGVGLSILLHRGSIWIGWKNQFYNKKKKEIENELSGHDNIKKSMEIFSYNEQLFLKLRMLCTELLKDNTLNAETKMLLHNNLNLLKQYSQEYDLQAINIIYNNCKQIELYINDEAMKSKLNTFIEYLGKMTIDDPKEYKGIGHGFIPAAEIIQEETQRCLANWLTVLETNVINKNTIDTIISNAMQIMKLTSFSSETLKGTNKDNLISELQDFISFYDKTIQSFKKLPKAEQEQLQPEIEILEKIGQYALTYYKALNYLVSTEILYGYKISKGNKMYFLEQIGIMNIVRKIYGIQTGIYLSKKNFKKEIIKVKNLGNELISGLYDSKIEQSVDEFFKEKEKPKYFYLGINESWKVRKMLARFLPLIFFTRSVVSSILTNSFSLNSITVSFFTGVGLSIILHWLPILSGFFKTKTIKQVKFPFREQQKVNNDIEINKQLLLQKQVNKLSNVPYGDIPDLVIIAGNNIEYTTDILNNSMENIKTFGNFKNLNIETLLLNNDGGSGNSLIDIFSFLQSDDLKIKYPNLVDKDLSELKIVVINIDGAPSSSVTNPLDVEVITQKTTPIELALLNGIGLIQNNKKENGNIVIVDPSYMYLGNLAQTDNITLLSSNITYDQMETQKLPLFISNPLESAAGSSSSRLKKIYNKFNNNKIVNIVVKYMLYKIYDIDNLSIQQMPTFAGIIAMNFADKKKFQEIIQFMNIVKQYEQNYKGEKFQIDMMAHLLVPLTRLLNDEDIFVYLENLKYSVDDMDKENYDKFFWGLFQELNNNFQRITATDSYINVITSQDSLMTKMQPDNKFYKKFITIFSLLKQFNIKQQITSVKRDITNFILPQKKTALFIVPQMTDLVKQHIVAFDNDSSNNFTITSLNQLSDNKKDSGIIINVPIENTIIPAKVMYDMFIDDKGKNHIIIAFMPILFDDIDMYCSVQETEILNSILSDDKTDINQIRQKMFIGRATLSLIKELQLNNGKSLIMEDSSFIMQKIEPSVIISFDDFGIFATPQLVSDSFVKDQNLQSIQHLNMNISDNTSTDIPIELIKQLHLSNMVNEYNVTEDNKVHLSILSSLISNYNFSFKELDVASLLNKPKQYAENIMSMVFNSSNPNDVSNSINNIGILPTISLKKFSDIKKYCELFSGTMLDKIIIQNVLFYDNSINTYNLLNFTLIDIAAEINRLNNPQFNKLKELLDVKESINKEMSTNEIFVLNNLLNYLKSNEKENIKFQQFINNQSAIFRQELEYLTAIQINKNLQNVANQDIEILKKQNADKWNFYYSLNEYMQYIAYIQYNDMQQYLASHQIRMIVAYDLLKHKDNMELILQELTVLKNKYNVNGFYINNLFVHKYQEQVMKFLRVNIPNDTTLIFDNANYGLLNQYTNTYIVSDNTASNSITNDIKEELIQLDLYNIKNTDIVNTIQDLSKRYKLVSMIINITDVFDNTDLMNDIFSINKLLKENNKNIEYYSDQAAGTVDKYQKQLSQDTTNGIISKIDISNINDINEEQMFEYVYKVLQEANINMENYKYIWQYIDKLKVNYEYAKQYRQQIALMQLKGYLAGIYNCQNIVDLGMQNYKINLISMNSILRSA